jgi:hypothetical protein
LLDWQCQSRYHPALHTQPGLKTGRLTSTTLKGCWFYACLYKKAGAKYFFSMGVHHDNFDLWNSKYTRWNAVNMGPKKDIVGLWQKAARNNGLKFGVSEHL